MLQARGLVLVLLLCAAALSGCMTTVVTQKAGGGDLLDSSRPPRAFALRIEAAALPRSGGALALLAPYLPVLQALNDEPEPIPASLPGYSDAEIRSYLRAFDCPCAVGLGDRTTLRCFDPLELRQHPELVIDAARRAVEPSPQLDLGAR